MRCSARPTVLSDKAFALFSHAGGTRTMNSTMHLSHINNMDWFDHLAAHESPPRSPDIAMPGMLAPTPPASPPLPHKRDSFRRHGHTTGPWSPKQTMSIEAGEEAAKQISARHASTQPVDTRSSRMRDTVALHRARANEKARLLALEIPTRREMERDACLLLETRRAHQEHFDTGARNTRGAYRNTAGSLYSSPRAPRGSRLPAPPPSDRWTTSCNSEVVEGRANSGAAGPGNSCLDSPGAW